MSEAGPLRTVARLSRVFGRHPSTTTVTVTRVTGTHQDEETGEEVPDTVIVTTEAPVQVRDPNTAVKTVLRVAAVAAVVALSGYVWHLLWEDLHK